MPQRCSLGPMTLTDRPLNVRRDLASLQPYASPQQPARYRMNTNESPYPPPDALIEEVQASLAGAAFNRYPDHGAAELVEAIARANDWPATGVWVANGSNEVFLHLFLAYGGPGRRAVTFEPTYSMHAHLAAVAGTEVLRAAREADFGIAGDTIAEMCGSGAELLLHCSPNNPTGDVESPDTVRMMLEGASGLVVVDEAYIEFASPELSVRDLLKDNENLVITRTFSKAWRLAGVRLGYLLAHPSVVEGLRVVGLPYHLSTPSQAVGLAALEHQADTLETVAMIVKERTRIIEGLRAMGIAVHDSHANFVLFEVGDPHEATPERTDRIWQGFLDRGVLLRNYSKTLGSSLRVTAGLPEETDAFLDAAEEVLGAAASV